VLKEIAPRVTRVAVLRDPTQGTGTGQLGAIQSAASQLGVEFRPVGVRDAREIERGIIDFARGSNGGLIVTAGTQARDHRELIIGLAARYRLPAVYFNRLFVEAGGLISYGADTIDPLRRAANYVDRILKGEVAPNKMARMPWALLAHGAHIGRPSLRQLRKGLGNGRMWVIPILRLSDRLLPSRVARGT
jgi:ABC-type uncharacterized transport system substrate-binding protein